MLSFIKFGPGGIRTHDQRIMSPLRYRCATGPYFVAYCIQLFALESALPTSQSNDTQSFPLRVIASHLRVLSLFCFRKIPVRYFGAFSSFVTSLLTLRKTRSAECHRPVAIVILLGMPCLLCFLGSTVCLSYQLNNKKSILL